MIKKLLIILLLSVITQASKANDLATFPVQSEGRIKPLDTIAREHLTILSSKDHLANLSAIDWYTELLFDHKNAYQRPVIKIHNPDLVSSLNLTWHKTHLYSFAEISDSLSEKQNLITELSDQEINTLTLTQKQLVQLHLKQIWYYQISQSLSSIIPELDIRNNLATALENKDLKQWKESIKVFKSNNLANFNKLKLEVFYNKISPFNIALIFYLLSLLCIFIGALIHLRKKHIYNNLSFAFLNLGALTHLFSIIIRVIILSRPPVATLYESIIFVSLITSFFAILMQLKKRNIQLTFVANIIAIILLFIANKYNVNEDSFGMLEAVLNNNFWLGTHVLTISIGYGCCLICGCLSHIYVFQANLKNTSKTSQSNLLKSIVITSLIALFFSITGTILGGIWADQSWGRFWGWDPKENGALFICLWLIFMLHGKIAKLFNNFYFCLGLAFINIVVALAWYGVNLLNVGLHSYGFTENIAFNLFLFCAIEMVFLTSMYVWYLKKTN
jgi:ABC-type transport system involved in cytochrome c biogenesis permease subunit